VAFLQQGRDRQDVDILTPEGHNSRALCNTYTSVLFLQRNESRKGNSPLRTGASAFGKGIGDEQVSVNSAKGEQSNE
jgi:hypothetical protein